MDINNEEYSCSYCSPSGKPLGLLVCTHPPKGEKRESNEGERGRGEHQRQRRALKMLQIPALPPT